MNPAKQQQNLSRTTPAVPVYALNTNNIVVASFSALLILLLLAFAVGVMYICAKLRRQRAPASDLGDTGWVHSSFSRGGGGTGGSAAATAAMYRQGGGALSWDGSESLRRQQDPLAMTTALAMDRPAFFARTEARANPTVGAGASIGVGGSGGAAGGLVRAALPRVAERQQQQQQQPRCLSFDDDQQPYDQLRMQRLALSGPFVNEHGGSNDSLDDRGGNLGDRYQSEEYLDVLVKK